MGDILFLAHRVPYPPDRGDKIRAFHVLKYLAARKRVHLIAFADDRKDLSHRAIEQLTGSRTIVWRGKGRARAAIEALARRQPVSITAFRHPRVARAVTEMLARHAIDSIYVFSSQMAQYIPARVRQRVVMDFVDVDSAKFDAYAHTARWPARSFYAREARLLLAHDRAIAERVRASIFVSDAEATLFVERTRAPNVAVVENGIDTAYFDPAAPFRRIESPAPLIVFTGQMDYPPNVEAAVWFVDAVLPHIRLRHPDVRVAIVGRNPAGVVKALASRTGIAVTGEVPDVRPWLAAAAVVVAPLKLARGIQNKVLEAMAMARPVVASAAATEGIDHAGTLRVGDDVGGIADAITALLADPAAGAELGRAARAQVIERYGWEARLAPLDDLLGLAPRTDRRSAA